MSRFVDPSLMVLDSSAMSACGPSHGLCARLLLLSITSCVTTFPAILMLTSLQIELRGDAIKVCINHRRSAPKRAESIGPWLETLVRSTLACVA